MVAKVEAGGSGVDGESGVSRWKLFHFEWISNEVLLCNTGNCVQSLGIEHDGRKYEKRDIYILLGYSAVQQK